MKEVKMRRYQNLLTISGLGVIAFGAWSVLKSILLFFFRDDSISKAIEEASDSSFIRTITIIVIALLLSFDFLIRLYVGLSARAEGFGKKKGYAYVVFAILIAITSIISLVLIFSDPSSLKENSIVEMTVTVIVEMTSLVVVIELLVAAFTVKKLKKELGEVE